MRLPNGPSHLAFAIFTANTKMITLCGILKLTCGQRRRKTQHQNDGGNSVLSGGKGSLRVTVFKAGSVTCNGPWHKEGVRVAGKGVRDDGPDGFNYFGGGLQTRCLALVAAALLAAASLMSLLIHAFCLFCLFCLFSEK